jgi:cytochrome c oxidase cbb3-type subunit 3
MRTLLPLLGILLASQMVSSQALPPGPGADVLTSRCVVCHGADIITQQKLSLTGWTNSISKMVRWGAQITPEERAVLQPYLAMHFGPKPAPSHPAPGAGAPAVASAAAGEATYKRACQVCHGADIVEQQKLTKTGWTRSVEKMMRWGAAVPDGEKEPLVDYLASRFPPR